MSSSKQQKATSAQDLIAAIQSPLSIGAEKAIIDLIDTESKQVAETYKQERLGKLNEIKVAEREIHLQLEQHRDRLTEAEQEMRFKQAEPGSLVKVVIFTVCFAACFVAEFALTWYTLSFVLSIRQFSFLGMMLAIAPTTMLVFLGVVLARLIEWQKAQAATAPLLRKTAQFVRVLFLLALVALNIYTISLLAEARGETMAIRMEARQNSERIAVAPTVLNRAVNAVSICITLDGALFFLIGLAEWRRLSALLISHAVVRRLRLQQHRLLGQYTQAEAQVATHLALWEQIDARAETVAAHHRACCLFELEQEINRSHPQQSTHELVSNVLREYQRTPESEVKTTEDLSPGRHPAKVTAEEVEREASGYILHKLGDRLWAGEPVYNERSEQWIVPVHSRSLLADVEVGQITLDATGAVINAPSRKALQGAFEQHYTKTDPQPLQSFERKLPLLSLLSVDWSVLTPLRALTVILVGVTLTLGLMFWWQFRHSLDVHTEQANRYIIFVDQSASVTEAQWGEWGKTVDGALGRLKASDEIEIFGLHSQTLNANPIFQAVIPPLETESGLEELSMSKRQVAQIRREAQESFNQALNPQQRTAATDIFSAIDRVKSDQTRETVLIFMSDMLNSMRELDLEKVRLAEKNIPELVNSVVATHHWQRGMLNGTTVRCLLPPVNVSVAAPLNDRLVLRQFWQTLFDYLGAKVETFDTH